MLTMSPVLSAAQPLTKPTKVSTATSTKSTPSKKTSTTSTSSDMSTTSTSSTSSSPATGTIADHDYVDLALPSGIKWATTNVGANSPEEYGDYYAWGETSTKESYDTINCSTWRKDVSDIGGTSRDVARIEWGSPWRMPTEAEFDELFDWHNCTCAWTIQYGHEGYKVTSIRNGNSIFLPAAGWRNGTSLNIAGQYGYYWSSTPYGGDTRNACIFNFYSNYHYTFWNYRSFGHTVRPVAE